MEAVFISKTKQICAGSNNLHLLFNSSIDIKPLQPRLILFDLINILIIVDSNFAVIAISVGFICKLHFFWDSNSWKSNYSLKLSIKKLASPHCNWGKNLTRKFEPKNQHNGKYCSFDLSHDFCTVSKLFVKKHHKIRKEELHKMLKTSVIYAVCTFANDISIFSGWSTPALLLGSHHGKWIWQKTKPP